MAMTVYSYRTDFIVSSIQKSHKRKLSSCMLQNHGSFFVRVVRCPHVFFFFFKKRKNINFKMKD